MPATQWLMQDLEDGSRLNAIIPPLAIKNPVITIRKFSTSLESMEALLTKGTLTAMYGNFLRCCS